jgi:hypothetical protein
MSRSRVGLTVLKAPTMSSDSREATWFFDFQIVQTCSVTSSNIVSVKRLLRAPICVSGRSLYSSAVSRSLLAVTALISLLIVFRSTIGRYVLGLLYKALLGLRITIVRACLNL